MNNPIISFEDFSFRYQLRENWALDKINIQLSKGDFVVLTGASGSGKSSLCYSLLGLIPNFYAGELKGRLNISNQKTNQQSIFSVSESIGYIPQRVDSSLITPYVFTELAFTLEYQEYEKKAMEQRIEKVSEELNLQDLLHRNPQKTSEGEKQKIAIGCALIRDPSIIIADEPLANLDRKNREMINSIFRKLKDKGKTIIVASHEYKQYLSLASKIVKLDRGIIIEEVLPENYQKKISKIKKKETAKKSTIQGKSPIEYNEIMLELDDIIFDFPSSFRLSNISLTAVKGEIIGIIGDNGSGKTTLFNVIGGLLKPKSGTLRIKNEETKNLNWQARSQNLGVVFQNPELQFFEETVKDEIALTKRNIEDNFDISNIAKLLEDANLEGYEDYNPHSLSHGEKRRLAYLASIFHNPEIIMIDEITNGLDEDNKKWIKNNLLEQKQKGKTILVISHDWDWLVGLIDRALYLEDGKIKTKMNKVQFSSFKENQLNQDNNYES